MFLLALLACSSPTHLTTVSGATRLAELANGELLVGTDAGALWLVDSFGGSRELATLGAGPIAELVADPAGRYWARAEDGRVFEGAIWAAPTLVGAAARVLVRDCSESRWLSGGAAAEVTALALGADCDTLIQGTADGSVRGTRVSSSPIRRVHAVGTGALWVDEEGNAGCLGCTVAAPRFAVQDVVPLHLAPFVPGELVWLDTEGRLWAIPG